MSFLDRRMTDVSGAPPWPTGNADLPFAPPPALALLASGKADIAPADWDLLFHAVIERLEALAGPVGPSAPLPHDSHALAERKAPVDVLRECIAALDQLRASAVRGSARPRDSGLG